MHHLSARWIALVVVSILSAAAAHASTMCLWTGTDTNFQPRRLVVFKSFGKPPKGGCRQLAGYEAASPYAFPASATVCLNAARTRLYVGLTVHPFAHAGAPGGSAGQNVHYSLGLDFPYPTLQGASIAYEKSDGSFIYGSVNDAYLAPCKPTPMP